jgi:hypothetical protein
LTSSLPLAVQAVEFNLEKVRPQLRIDIDVNNLIQEAVTSHNTGVLKGTRPMRINYRNFGPDNLGLAIAVRDGTLAVRVKFEDGGSLLRYYFLGDHVKVDRAATMAPAAASLKDPLYKVPTLPNVSVFVLDQSAATVKEKVYTAPAWVRLVKVVAVEDYLKNDAKSARADLPSWNCFRPDEVSFVDEPVLTPKISLSTCTSPASSMEMVTLAPVTSR